MMNEMYRQLGVSPAVYDFGEKILGGLRERFAEIDGLFFGSIVIVDKLIKLFLR